MPSPLARAPALLGRSITSAMVECAIRMRTLNGPLSCGRHGPKERFYASIGPDELLSEFAPNANPPTANPHLTANVQRFSSRARCPIEGDGDDQDEEAGAAKLTRREIGLLAREIGRVGWRRTMRRRERIALSQA
jgi:hypothetical protein